MNQENTTVSAPAPIATNKAEKGKGKASKQAKQSGIDTSDLIKAIKSVETVTAALNRINPDNLPAMINLARMSGMNDLEIQAVIVGAEMFLTTKTRPAIVQKYTIDKALSNAIDTKSPRAYAYGALLQMQKAHMAVKEIAKKAGEAKQARAAAAAANARVA